MTDRLVTPIPKAVAHLTQRQRRAAWERDKQAGYDAVDARSGGVCEVDGCTRRATSHHHMAGRVGPGPVVNDPEILLHLCGWCDERITRDPTWAKANGYSLDRVPRGTSKDMS